MTNFYLRKIRTSKPELNRGEIELITHCLNILRSQWGDYSTDELQNLIEKLEAIAPPPRNCDRVALPYPAYRNQGISAIEITHK